jgi:CRP/FNR family transcriptional regulator
MASTAQTAPSSHYNILHNLSADELARVDAISKPLQFKTNEYICHSGAESPYVYRIDSGCAMTERLSSNGKRHVMAFLFPGSFVGFFDWLSFDLSVKSLQQTQVTVFPRGAFFKLCEEIPQLKDNMDRIAKAILASALDYMYMLSQKNADERLCFFLQQLALREKGVVDGDIIVPCSREDIADHLGLSKETISRAMTRLRTKRIIRQERANTIRILDSAAMALMSK